MREAVIVSATRTAVGKAPRGALRNVHTADLAATAIKAAIARAPGLDPKEIDDVILGCAMPEAEQGLNMARVATLRVKNRPSTLIEYHRNARPHSMTAMPIQNCNPWCEVSVVPGGFALTMKIAANTPAVIATNSHACEPRSRLTAPFSTVWKNVPANSGAKHTKHAT